MKPRRSKGEKQTPHSDRGLLRMHHCRGIARGTARALFFGHDPVGLYWGTLLSCPDLDPENKLFFSL